MNNVLIIEDHPLVAEMTTGLIARHHPDVSIVVCKDAKEATRALTDQHEEWHRILLDLDVPGALGLSLAKLIRDRGLQARCCVVTGTDRLDLSGELKAMGFLGYIIKGFPVEQITEALRKVFQGERVFLSTGTNRSGADTETYITSRQAQIFALARDGLSSKQIADKLSLSVGTVDNHISTGMRALNVTTRAQAVAKAMTLGLIPLRSDPHN